VFGANKNIGVPAWDAPTRAPPQLIRAVHLELIDLWRISLSSKLIQLGKRVAELNALGIEVARLGGVLAEEKWLEGSAIPHFGHVAAALSGSEFTVPAGLL
jgi:hypothetical protein